MFRASSAHLQEDTVVYMQHMVLSLSMRVPGGLWVTVPYAACTQRDLLKLQLSKQKNWPASKVELITKHRKVLSEFIESTDFDLLQKSDK